MVNWNKSLLCSRLPSCPSGATNLCTMNSKICEDDDLLAKFHQIGVLFGFPCNVRCFAFLEMCNLSSQLGWMNSQSKQARQEVLQVHELDASAWTTFSHEHSCGKSTRKLRSSMPRYRLFASCYREVHGPPRWFTAKTRSRFSFSDKEFLFIYDFVSSPYRSREAALPRCVGFVPNF